MLERALDAVAHTQHARVAGAARLGDNARQAGVDDRRRPTRLADQQRLQEVGYPASATWRSGDEAPRRSRSAAMVVRMKAGRSAGEREVTSVPSRTTSRSTQFAPALTMSSLMLR